MYIKQGERRVGKGGTNNIHVTYIFSEELLRRMNQAIGVACLKTRRIVIL